MGETMPWPELNDEEHGYGRDPVKLAQLLEGRDRFIVEAGLWPDFAEWLRHPQQPKPNRYAPPRNSAAAIPLPAPPTEGDPRG